MSSSSHTFFDPIDNRPSRPQGYTQQSYSNVDHGRQYNFQNTYNSSFDTGRQSAAHVGTGHDPMQTENHAAAATLSSLGGKPYVNNDSSGFRDFANDNRQSQTWYNPNAEQHSEVNSLAIAQNVGSESLYTGMYPQQSYRTSQNYPQTRDGSEASTHASSTQRQSEGSASDLQAQWSQRYPQSQPSQPQSSQTQPHQQRVDRHNPPANTYQARQHTEAHVQQSQHQSQHLQNQSTPNHYSLSPSVPPQPGTTSAPRNLATSAARPQQNSALPPVTTTERHNSAPATALPLTINPLKIYDHHAEQQRKTAIETERKRKMEAENAAREQKELEEQRQAQAIIQARLLAATKESQTPAIQATSGQGVVQSKASGTPRSSKKAQSSKKKPRQAKEQTTQDERTQSVAQSTEATAEGRSVDEEAEMRAMFLKMRDFNARNPAMLAKLWEEERTTHLSTQSTPPAQSNIATEQVRAPKTSASATKSSEVRASRPATAVVQSPQDTVLPGRESSQIQTVQPVKQNVLWPPHTRYALADSAAKWLQSLPQNTQKPVSADSISKILNRNPNYAQLCAALEKDGLKFERSALARHLLTVVPDTKAQGRKSTSPQSSAVPVENSADIQAPVQLLQKLQNTTDSDAKRSQPVNKFVAYEIPLLSAHDDNDIRINAMATTAPAAPSDSLPKQDLTPIPDGPAKAPANKEEAARKRTFGEIVDLTADMDSDDDDISPAKKIKSILQGPGQAQSAREAALAGPPNMQQDRYSKTQPTPSLPSSQQIHEPIQATAQPSLNGTPNQSLPPPSQPKRSKALERQQLERMRGRMLVEPIMRDRVARKSRYDPRTIARDVLLATGRHPDMRPLNSHLLGMEKLLGAHGGSYNTDGQHGNRSDLATIQWQILDPEPLELKALFKQPVAANVISEGRTHVDQAEKEGNHSVMRHTETDQKVMAPNEVAIVAIPAYSNSPPKKRRGRPPRDDRENMIPKSANDNKHETPSHAGRRHSRGESNVSGGTPAELHKTKMSSSVAGTPIGYAAFRQMDENGNVIKKMGRPVGWRKSLHSKEVNGKDQQALPVRHGPKSTAKPTKLQDAQYQIYRCGWEGCDAKLHNLETLKKHVIKVHGAPSPEKSWICYWSSCSVGGSKSRQRFQDMKDWLSHVDAQHFSPIAWKLGDGPRGGQVALQQHDIESEAYLSDARGRSVTPVIEATSNRVPDSASTAKQPKDLQKANKELDVFRAHKRAIGFSIDRTGCILPNEKRRMGFMDDEDFEEVVEEGDSDD